jgi:hypothetical protein
MKTTRSSKEFRVSREHEVFVPVAIYDQYLEKLSFLLKQKEY